MISVKNLSIETLKGRKLIENLSFNLNEGDKLAVIGEEGNGKSTLLKTILNEEVVSKYCKISGKIEKPGCVIGYLEQKLNSKWNDYSVMDYFLKRNWKAEPDYSVYNEMHQIERVLKNLNFKLSHLHEDTLIGCLSGGEKVKLQIAKLLMGNYDLILLDEPTNDLDIETLEKLEYFIKNTKVLK